MKILAVATQAAAGLVFLGAAVLGGSAHGQFVLRVTSTGFLPDQQMALQRATARWETVITGYQPGIARTGIDVLARALEIDGPGGMAAVAGPVNSTTAGGFVLTSAGSIQVDTADLRALAEAGLLETLFAHELGHILGIGTQWVTNGVYVDGTGQYLGPAGVAAYRSEFAPDATFVPVELDGGVGTADGHWAERTDVADPLGRPLADELMTGHPSGDHYLSNMTVQSLRDIGFEVVVGRALAGDVNGDGQVNGLDIDPFVDQLVGGAEPSTGDVNGDGAVNGLDVAPLANAILGGGTAVAGAPVPEPSSVVLGVLGLLVLAWRKRPRPRVTRCKSSRHRSRTPMICRISRSSPWPVTAEIARTVRPR